ncbi:DNA helicase IV [Vibrio hippocampi]|uniref:DNA 3'-5' helicase n=1 Tax=Vibrio hippocampi TaxID=654686 RepID=A0ABN8DMH1_9VIBR|nr:DNA helicase IV [Vibrio hippocampi]CAH0529636.1 DNA helicase IV [Vibrio hippocampi]
MLISASNAAQFFISKEFTSIELMQDSLILHSSRVEVSIPFNQWSGKLKINRGMLWSSVTVVCHPAQDQQVHWKVMGLDWQTVQSFASSALDRYQEWHHQQCRNLYQYLPQWQNELTQLVNLPRFLPASDVQQWRSKVQREFQQMEMSLEEAHRVLPDHIAYLQTWIEDTQQQLQQRNDQWIANERQNWQVLFSQSERSPLNESQQLAVLHNNDQNLILAGAGSGKTSVLMARVAYLLQSHIAQPEQLLMVAFGRDAAQEMKARLESKFGQSADAVSVLTFHQLGLKIINQAGQQSVSLAPIVTDMAQKKAWCIDWLKKHWMTPANFKRWQKHLSTWPIAYLTGDDELGSQSENPKLIAWLEQQLDQLISSSLNKKDIQQKIINHPDYTRLNSELALCWPCYQAWQKMMRENKQVDFTTMITQATSLVESGRFTSPWRFMMVDEYQDISPDRLALLEALCRGRKTAKTDTGNEHHKDEQKKPEATLFAVGDDWQSIYQFTGSDVDLTTGFQRRFPDASIHQLDTTYRFADNLGHVASEFIQANPAQLNKQLNSARTVKQNAVVIEHGSKIEGILTSLNNKKSSSRVLLLGRNHYHKPEQLENWQAQFEQLDLEFMTCHASKGQEADFVIIVAVDEGQFPSKQKFVHLNSALTAGTDDFPDAEERRLFYVALTRAKQKVWVCYQSQPSRFVRELAEMKRVTNKA